MPCDSAIAASRPASCDLLILRGLDDADALGLLQAQEVAIDLAIGHDEAEVAALDEPLQFAGEPVELAEIELAVAEAREHDRIEPPVDVLRRVRAAEVFEGLQRGLAVRRRSRRPRAGR